MSRQPIHPSKVAKVRGAGSGFVGCKPWLMTGRSQGPEPLRHGPAPAPPIGDLPPPRFLDWGPANSIFIAFPANGPWSVGRRRTRRTTLAPAAAIVPQTVHHRSVAVYTCLVGLLCRVFRRTSTALSNELVLARRLRGPAGAAGPRSRSPFQRFPHAHPLHLALLVQPGTGGPNEPKSGRIQLVALLGQHPRLLPLDRPCPRPPRVRVRGERGHHAPWLRSHTAGSHST